MHQESTNDFIVKVQAQIIRKQKEIVKNWQSWDSQKMSDAENFIKRKKKLINFAKSGKLDLSKYPNVVQNGLQKGLQS